MPDLLSVRMQDVLHRWQSELRAQVRGCNCTVLLYCNWAQMVRRIDRSHWGVSENLSVGSVCFRGEGADERIVWRSWLL